MNKFSSITRKGSKTFYLASLLFPKTLRKDVHIVYAYVRTIDDLIDQANPDLQTYTFLKKETLRCLTTDYRSQNALIDAFIAVFKSYNMKRQWLDSFFSSQELDLKKNKYQTYKELEEFIHGVAEVIGLFMASLMELPKASYPYAMLLGQSMQLLNIIRDIPQDQSIGRTYIPQEDMKRVGVKTFDSKSESHEKLMQLIRFEIDRFRDIHNKAKRGLSFIPKNYLPSILTSYNLYSYTADTIYKDPLVVFRKKVRPPVPKIIWEGVKSYINSDIK